MGPTTPTQATPWGAIGGFASSLIGLGLNNTMQQQQYQQNVDLMGLQHQNQMALNEQMQDIAQQNWDYTNYGNQVKHMQKAGLNVGLMYGGAGQGGQSTASSGGSAAMGQAPQNNTPQMLGLMQQAALNAAQIEKINAETNKIKTETPTGDKNTGDMLYENMKQAGIEQFTKNKIQAWMNSDPENKAGATEYNETYDYRAGIDETSKLNRQFEATLFKTQAEKSNLDASALLNNKKAQGYWTELLNETKKADAAAMQATAQKLAAEWSTGEFTNWKTWFELGKSAIQTASQAIKGGPNVQINNPTTTNTTTNY